MKIYAVMPAYNEEKTIKKIIQKAKKYCPVIVVDDGSTDRTSTIARKAGAIIFQHEKNMGYGKTLFDGINKAVKMKADFIITLDADGQHDPDDIPKFMEKLEEGYDIVSGSRFLSKESWGSRKRMLAIKLLTYQAYIFSRLRLTDVQSGFRGYNVRIFKEIQLKDSGMGFSVELPIKAKKKGFRFTEVPVAIKKPHNIKTFIAAFKQGMSVSISIIKHSLF